jgi:amicyanin
MKSQKSKIFGNLKMRFSSKLFAILALLALLLACAPKEPVKPIVDDAPKASFVVNPPVEAKAEAAPETTEAPDSSGSQTVKVDIVGFKYVPASVKVRVGDTVTWTQVDKVKHTVTTVDGPESFDSGLLSAGQTFSYTFTKPGTYSYKCTPHPNMRGEVIVE